MKRAFLVITDADYVFVTEAWADRTAQEVRIEPSPQLLADLRTLLYVFDVAVESETLPVFDAEIDAAARVQALLPEEGDDVTLDELCEAWETSTDPNDKSVAQPYVLALEAEVERLRVAIIEWADSRTRTYGFSSDKEVAQRNADEALLAIDRALAGGGDE